jgi:hypothetical protein
MKPWQSTHKRHAWAWASAAVFAVAIAGCVRLVRDGNSNAGTTPGAVTVLHAGPGGGSGEIALDWNAVPTATGYRVLRSEAAGGPFGVVADFDVTTGRVSAADDVVNIWSAQHSYVPARNTLNRPDRSPWFQYVEVSRTGERCFRVVAYNAAGNGPASAVVCGSPP